MSAEPAPQQFTVVRNPPPFPILRSELVDRFARLETAVCECIAKHSALDPHKKLFTQRLEEFAGLALSCEPLKEKKEALAQLAAECVALLPIRASIVHSVMKIEEREGEPVALFQNATDAAQGNLQYVVMSRADFDRIKRKLQSLADRAKL